MDHGGRSVKLWLAGHKFATVQYTQVEHLFWNINTQEDLSNYRRSEYKQVE